MEGGNGVSGSERNYAFAVRRTAVGSRKMEGDRRKRTTLSYACVNSSLLTPNF
ncbi:MAG: hypothetical protein IJQ39_08955 [Thermoguttaceae bacterium]|nr:hypothetical protein [Thermoguttaceae bacterium]